MTICTAQLDRVHGAIRITTGDDTVHRFRMSNHMPPIVGDMRFFVALPENPRLRRIGRRYYTPDTSVLPFPFLASTIRPAAAA